MPVGIGLHENKFSLLFVGVKTGSSLTVFVEVKKGARLNCCFEHSVRKDSGEDIENNILFKIIKSVLKF